MYDNLLVMNLKYCGHRVAARVRAVRSVVDGAVEMARILSEHRDT